MAKYRIHDKKAVWRSTGDKVVVLSLTSGAYFSLNPSASLLWRLIAEGKDSESLSGVLAKTFDVVEEEARRDVAEFLAQLEDEKLIVTAIPDSPDKRLEPLRKCSNIKK